MWFEDRFGRALQCLVWLRVFRRLQEGEGEARVRWYVVDGACVACDALGGGEGDEMLVGETVVEDPPDQAARGPEEEVAKTENTLLDMD